MANEQLTITEAPSLPPAQPAYVLRGHTEQIHAVHFFRDNLRLLTGDADGWVILWNIPIKRPLAVWRAHSNAILGLSTWRDDRIITHGRDNLLQVWQLRPEDEPHFSTVLPDDDSVTDRKQPWLLHSMPVNALNFCSFAQCPEQIPHPTKAETSTTEQGILIAVPGVHDGTIIVTSLPSEERRATIPAPRDIKTGMVMAIRLHHDKNSNLLVLAGYESGHCCIWKFHPPTSQWQTCYTYKAHSQPILSLDVAPKAGVFYTSSADAIIARHPLPGVEGSNVETKLVQTKHAGQQSMVVRSDEKVFATAGWDGRVRVYSVRTMKELAVLKWHKEGCYALAFAAVQQTDPEGVGTKAESAKGEDDQANDNTVVEQKKELTVSQRRTAKARSTHWLAAGSKDGKVSLWDIY